MNPRYPKGQYVDNQIWRRVRYRTEVYNLPMPEGRDTVYEIVEINKNERDLITRYEGCIYTQRFERIVPI